MSKYYYIVKSAVSREQDYELLLIATMQHVQIVCVTCTCALVSLHVVTSRTGDDKALIYVYMNTL